MAQIYISIEESFFFCCFEGRKYLTTVPATLHKICIFNEAARSAVQPDASAPAAAPLATLGYLIYLNVIDAAETLSIKMFLISSLLEVICM